MVMIGPCVQRVKDQTSKFIKAKGQNHVEFSRDALGLARRVALLFACLVPACLRAGRVPSLVFYSSEKVKLS